VAFATQPFERRSLKLAHAPNCFETQIKA